MLIPASAYADNVVRDVLYGCWCKGRRIGGGAVPPLNALTIATILKCDGVEVSLVDALEQRLPFEAVARGIRDFDVVLVLSSSMTVDEDADTVRRLKGIHPGLRAVFYGSHPSFMPRQCLADPSIDIVVRMEPDLIIRDLLRAMGEGGDAWKAVRGIGYREGEEVVLNEEYPFMNDMEDIPVADRTLLPRGARYFNPIVKRYPYTTSCTSRGCPGLCTFCTAPAFSGKQIRSWTVDRVIEEIRYLIGLGYREVYYRDETFTFSRRRVREICERIRGEGLDITWICNVRVGSADRDLLKVMKEAGCHLIKIGMESGAQEILDRSKKHIRVDETRRLFGWAREAGLDTHAHLMFGMPGETPETIDRTIAFIKEIEPTTIDIGICSPYPGSALFNELLREHPELGDENRLSLKDLHTAGTYNEWYTSVSREMLERSIRRAYREYYLRPGYLLKWLGRMRSREDAARIIRGGANVIRFSLFGD
ncbi:MAG: radical SAM protein [bacterium]|nr:radical SAM protein [bacterium]